MSNIYIKYNNRYLNVTQVTNIELVRDSLQRTSDLYEVRLTTACNTKLVIYKAGLEETQKYINNLMEKMGETTLDAMDVAKKVEAIEEVVQEVQQVAKKRRSVKKIDK